MRHYLHQTNRTDEHTRTSRLRDRETVLDVVVVVLILALLSSIVFFSIGGLRAAAAERGCGGDTRALGSAAEAYFVQQRAAVIPPTGTGHDRYERTLVDVGLLRAPSDVYDLDADGVVMPEGESPC